jgi:hypothetical protein
MKMLNIPFLAAGIGGIGGGPKGKRNGMYRHGLYTKEAVEGRRHMGALLRQVGALLSTV